jgi:hypothetical protein
MLREIIQVAEQTWRLDGTEMEVEVVLASRSANSYGPDLFTLRGRYPRIIHGEVMTHRVFSRNARSSRAVPVKTMLDEVRNRPFVPWHWGRNQKGMQATEECNELVELHGWTDYDGEGSYIEGNWVDREEAWKRAAFMAHYHAKCFSEAGYHKQLCNRLLEPFSWIDTLFTATDWENFLWLRLHEDAEPHMRDFARLVEVALKGANIQKLNEGEWHMPYIVPGDRRLAWDHLRKGKHADFVPHSNQLIALLCDVSAARCARISYAPFDGNPSFERELERVANLRGSARIHASPFEHQATPDSRCKLSYEWKQPELHGNFTGWIQNRKLIPGENKPQIV